MIKKTIKILIIIVLLIFIGYTIWIKTGLCSSYYFNKGKELYNAQYYDLSIKLFERSLHANPQNSAARYFLVLALTKGTPTYSHQEALYLMANSETKDMAQNYAKSQIFGLKERLLEGLEENYIYNAVQNKDILRWNIESFPLRVYFENANTNYKENIKKAFENWSKTSGFLQFSEVFKPEDSNIIIKFIPYTCPKCTNANCTYVVATTNNTTDKYHRLDKMIITFYNTNPHGEEFTNTEIYNTALHEIGHALGISGHSENPNDVMYSANHKSTGEFSLYDQHILYLSKRDLNTIALLYRLAPTITNSKGWYFENLYYPPLILGNDEEILKKKLDEFQAYINKMPNYSGGYINIATVYSSMGENKKAQESLDRAFQLATNDDERYLIYYNRAVLYYNTQDYNTAMENAKKAAQIKNNETTQTLIEDIATMIK